jgi:hypothetical protein
MPCVRSFLCLTALALTALLLTDRYTRGQQPAPPPKDAKTPSPTKSPGPAKPAPAVVKADKDAGKVLDQAIAELDPKKHPWMEWNVWEKADVQDVTSTCDGHYLLGPDRRMNLNLKVNVAGEDSEMRIVSDGKQVWNWSRSADKEERANRYDLTKVNALLSAPGTMPQFSDNFFKNQSFWGLLPLLQTLRQQMVFTSQTKENWQGHSVVKLTGAWSSDYAKAWSQNNVWAAYQPRNCRLYVDQQTHWPHRLEWWGPTAPRGPDSLLLEVEFREPHLLAAGQKPPDRYTQAFHFDAGKAEPRDLTEQYLQQISLARTQSGTAPTAPAPGSSTPSR